MSSLTHFPLEPGCEDYTFLDQTVEDFEQDLHSILIDSIETTESDMYFDKSDVITSLVSSALLCLVSTISDNSKLQIF